MDIEKVIKVLSKQIAKWLFNDKKPSKEKIQMIKDWIEVK